MRLCLDEHYSPRIAADLRARGFDAYSVQEHLELVGMGDADLFALMAAEKRAFLTENVADFAPLVSQALARAEIHYGVIYSSSHSLPRSRNTIGVFVERLAALLVRFPGEDDFAGRVEWL